LGLYADYVHGTKLTVDGDGPPSDRPVLSGGSTALLSRTSASRIVEVRHYRERRNSPLARASEGKDNEESRTVRASDEPPFVPAEGCRRRSRRHRADLAGNERKDAA
jgi:hypothetical protein